jgi:hypothetical protein
MCRSTPSGEAAAGRIRSRGARSWARDDKRERGLSLPQYNPSVSVLLLVYSSIHPPFIQLYMHASDTATSPLLFLHHTTLHTPHCLLLECNRFPNSFRPSVVKDRMCRKNAQSGCPLILRDGAWKRCKLYTGHPRSSWSKLAGIPSIQSRIN